MLFSITKKKRLKKSLLIVAGAGLEPATFGLWAQRATNCSTPRYDAKVKLLYNFDKKRIRNEF